MLPHVSSSNAWLSNRTTWHTLYNFPPVSWVQLLEAYLLQGVSGAELAIKITTCFKECITDTATRLVRSMVLAKAALSADSTEKPYAVGTGSTISRTSCSGLDEYSYEDLCKQLSPDAMQLCLSKLLEITFELLCSYHLMARWHEAGIEQQKQAAEAAAAAVKAAAQHRGDSDTGSRSSAGSTSLGGADERQQQQQVLPSQEQLDQVQAATKGMLEAVAQQLAACRLEVLQLAHDRVQPLLVHLGKCKSEEFLQVRWHASTITTRIRPMAHQCRAALFMDCMGQLVAVVCFLRNECCLSPLQLLQLTRRRRSCLHVPCCACDLCRW